MEKHDRRSFFRFMGQMAAVSSLSLSQKRTMAQSARKTMEKRHRYIDVDVHITNQDYNNYLDRLKSADGIGLNQAPPPQMPDLPEGEISFYTASEIEHIDLRLKNMDENGIDMQVLSWRNIGVSEFEVSDGIMWARRINNDLAQIVDKHPDRFAAFCNITWQAPDQAVRELERAVKDLGLVGIKIDSTIKGEYLDQKKYFPIFKKAAELRVPVFLHPDEMPAEMIKPYQVYGGLDGAAWGYAAEASLHALRLIYSGLFDELPDLQIMLGHMGEGLPYWLWRLDSKGASSTLKKKPSEYVRNNFYINTSGMFFHPALVCAHMAMGADRVLFGTDYPSELNSLAVEFINTAPLSVADRIKICQHNAERLFKLA